jgi:hypothetical protein
VAQPHHEHDGDQQPPHQPDDRTLGALDLGGEEETALEDDVGDQRLN